MVQSNLVINLKNMEFELTENNDWDLYWDLDNGPTDCCHQTEKYGV